ncbi:hypothetical protein [Burkholderia sp. 22313]|uniref:hypothetical protein n=1 Tax=Burkholderia sp. 22313 TaxID=3453908 RepID=UPI002CCDE5BF|nr:hypothetical protein [Burkholderia sp.]
MHYLFSTCPIYLIWNFELEREVGTKSRHKELIRSDKSRRRFAAGGRANGNAAGKPAAKGVSTGT